MAQLQSPIAVRSWRAEIICGYVLTALLLMAVGAQGYFRLLAPRGESAARMPKDLLPANLAGYTMKEVEIASTESMSQAVSEGLGFTDYSYREYRRGDRWFSVYLAHWVPRVRHFSEVGTHVPDNCWVTSGWTLVSKEPKRSFILPDASGIKNGDIPNSWPGETRIFQAGAQKLRVVYWHLLAGRPLDYTHYGQGKTMGYFWDNRAAYISGSGEQYFVRITTNGEWAELEAEAGFQQMLARLASKVPLLARMPPRP